MNEHRPVIVTAPKGTAAPGPASWRGFSAGLLAMPAGTIEVPGSPNHFLSMHVGAPVWMNCCCDGHSGRRLQTHGDIDIVPAGLPGVWEDESPGTILLLTLSPGLLHAVAEGIGLNPGRATLTSRFQIKDPRIEHIGWALKAELESGDASEPIYAESLGLALAAHLLRYYGSEATLPKPGQRLSKHQLRRVIDFIDENLSETLTLADLAKAVGMSASHFKTLFRHATGLPAHQYVIRRRVEHAKRLLLQGQLPLSQVALASGFAHQSHMARCMRRVLGVTPTDIIQSRR